MSRKTERRTFVLVACAIMLGLLLTARYLSAPDTAFPVGQEHMVDDFGFVLNSYRWADDELEVKASLNNHAKVVNFTFAPSMVRAFAPDGVELNRLGSEPATAYVLAPGQSGEFTLRFKGRGKDRTAQVRFVTSPDIIAAFLGAIFGERAHVEIQAGPTHPPS